MNKTFLSPLLIALLSTQVNAAEPAVPNDTANETTTSTIMAPPPAPAEPTTTPAPTPALDCNYHIPANQTAIDSALITSWAEKAALQSFTFTPATIQNQLDMLKTCYTEQGWKGFNDALQKSGNVDSIKNQQLTVSGQAEGVANINTVKDGQWKVTLPIQVVYQNDKEKVTQHLLVGVLVGRKPNGDLGIMQLVATARPEEAPAAAAPAPAEPKPANDMQPTTSPSPNDTPAGPATPSQPVQPTTPKPLP